MDVQLALSSPAENITWGYKRRRANCSDVWTAASGHCILCLTSRNAQILCVQIKCVHYSIKIILFYLLITTNKLQLFLIIYFWKALHISGGSSAHHQEHITVHSASGIVSHYCCRLVSWVRWILLHPVACN